MKNKKTPELKYALLIMVAITVIYFAVKTVLFYGLDIEI